jgi:hypothetical protein
VVFIYYLKYELRKVKIFSNENSVVDGRRFEIASVKNITDLQKSVQKAKNPAEEAKKKRRMAEKKWKVPWNTENMAQKELT